jgi:chromosome segregation ATPase
LHYLRTANAPRVDSLERETQDNVRAVDEALAEFDKIALRPERTRALKTAIRNKREIRTLVLEKARKGGPDLEAGVQQFLTEGEAAQKEIDSLTEEIVSFNQGIANNLVQSQRTQSEAVFWVLLSVSVVALLFGLGGTWSISRVVVRAIGEIRTSIGEIQTAAQQQVTSAQEQAAAISQNTATLTEIRETSREAADRSKAVGEASVQAAKSAQGGQAVSGQLATRSEETRSKIERMAQSLLGLSEQAQRIGDIVVSVNEISEQTKILALNASIEAAKAGEEGKGFAVVATQIRELANQSKEAGGRINAVIGDIQKAARLSGQEAQEGTRVASEMAEAMKKMGESFQEISTTIEEVSQQVVQVAAGGRQQEAGIQQVTAAISQIDAGMKQALAAAQQTLKSIGRISDQVRLLGPTGDHEGDRKRGG